MTSSLALQRPQPRLITGLALERLPGLVNRDGAAVIAAAAARRGMRRRVTPLLIRQLAEARATALAATAVVRAECAGGNEGHLGRHRLSSRKEVLDRATEDLGERPHRLAGQVSVLAVLDLADVGLRIPGFFSELHLCDVSQFHRPRQAVAAALPAPPQGLDLVLREHEQI